MEGRSVGVNHGPHSEEFPWPDCLRGGRPVPRCAPWGEKDRSAFQKVHRMPEG